MKINIKSSVEFTNQEEKETIQDFLDELKTACNNGTCSACTLKEFCDDNVRSASLSDFVTELREVLEI